MAGSVGSFHFVTKLLVLFGTRPLDFGIFILPETDNLYRGVEHIHRKDTGGNHSSIETPNRIHGDLVKANFYVDRPVATAKHPKDEFLRKELLAYILALLVGGHDRFSFAITQRNQSEPISDYGIHLRIKHYHYITIITDCQSMLYFLHVIIRCTLS